LEAGLQSGWKEVPGLILTPDRPARADWPQPGTLCLIPKEKLKPGTAYTARFRYRELGAAREWTFTTRR
jgi:hypothetical protein